MFFDLWRKAISVAFGRGKVHVKRRCHSCIRPGIENLEERLTPALSFGAAVNYGTGHRPYAVAVSDFNKDGNPDLAVANFGAVGGGIPGTVSVLLGNGSGSFAPAVDFGVNGSPSCIALGDFNNDGNLDIVTGNDASQSVSVLLGNGLGGFGSALVISNVDNNVASVAVADFNKDGNLDIVCANSFGDNVSVLFGNGLGGLAVPVKFNVGTTFNPFSVAVGDFNKDGNPDFVAANITGNYVSVVLGDGLGGFSAPTSLAVGTNPRWVAVGEFNGDGNSDLVTANVGTFSVLLGNGMGSFAAAANFNTFFAKSVAVADFDLDGKQDVVSTGTSSVGVYLGDGLGGFGTGTSFAAGSNIKNVAVGDFNKDGKPDMVVANDFQNTVNVLLNTSTVPDTIPPNVTAPANITVPNTTGMAGAVVTFAATASDNSGSVNLTYSPGSGSFFPIGMTTVNVTATDPSGNSSSASFTITVLDVETPNVTAPANITVPNTTGMAGAVVTFAAAMASDNSGTATISYSKNSGTFFPLGTTTVTATATDPSDNSASATFTVTVSDVEPPNVTAPTNITVPNTTGMAGAVVTFAASASDNSGSVNVTYSPGSGSFFPIGTTTVFATATDPSGNSAIASFTVTVSDIQPPNVMAPANITVPKDPGLAGAVVTFAATASDNSGSAVITYSQNPGTVFPLGVTTVIVTATDPSGNSASANFTITVTGVNHAPSLTASDLAFSYAANQSLATLTATDPDNDPITYSASIDSIGHYLRTTYNLAFPTGNLAGLTSGAPSAANLYYNYGGKQDKWLAAPGGVWYIILPNGDFYRWSGHSNTANMAAGFQKITVSPVYWQNPGRIRDEVLGEGPIDFSVSGNQLTFDNPTQFEGQFRVTATVTDGSLSDTKSFFVNFTNLAPSLDPIANQTMPPTQDTITVALVAADAESDTITLSATVQSQTQIVKADIGSKQPASLGMLFDESSSNNYGRVGEKWLSSRDAVGNSIYFYILPTGDLFRWDGTPNVAQGSFVANVGTNVYATPSLLINPLNPPATTSIAGSNLTVDPAAGFRGNLIVTARATDTRGNVTSRVFTVTVAPAPTLTQPTNISITGPTATPITLNATDPSGLTLTYSVVSEALLLKTTYDLKFSGNLYTNFLGLGEKWLHGAGPVNQAPSWYYVTPAGQLFRWQAVSGNPAGQSTFVRTIDTRYHTNPALLYNAHIQATFSLVGNTLTVTPNAGFTGTLVLTVFANNGVFQDNKTFTVTVN